MYKDYIEYKRSHIAPSTAETYERWVIRFSQFMRKTLKKDVFLFELQDFTQFQTHLHKCGYAPANIQLGLQVVRGYLSYLHALGHIQVPVNLLKVKRERTQPHYAITKDEYVRMVDSLDESQPVQLQRKLIISMLWDTGMRVSELLSLRESEVGERCTLIWNRKNTNKRLVAWSKRTHTLLQKYLRVRKQRDITSDWLFSSLVSLRDAPLSKRQVEYVVRSVSNHVGIQNKVRPHSFRHGFVHVKLSQNVPIPTIAQLLGHTSVFNVMNYSQLSSNEIREAWGV